MDSSDLVKQANNHEQPLKRENSTQKKRETRPQRQNQATGKKISISTENLSVLMILVSKAQCNFLN
jgi:hypothetical protein